MELAYPVFARMKQGGHVKPNAVTFTNMLAIGKKLGKEKHKQILEEVHSFSPFSIFNQTEPK